MSSALRLECAEVADPAIQVQVLDVVEVGLERPALLGAVGVDVLVGHDPKQPGPQVGALFESGVAAIRAEVRLLDQVFGIGGISSHAQRRAVQLRCVLHGLLSEFGPICHVVDPSPSAPKSYQFLSTHPASGRAVTVVETVSV